jgi:hypothetical protein
VDRALNDANEVFDRDDGRGLDPGQLHPEAVLEGNDEDDGAHRVDQEIRRELVVRLDRSMDLQVGSQGPADLGEDLLPEVIRANER